jgi:hypothetical protein
MVSPSGLLDGDFHFVVIHLPLPEPPLLFYVKPLMRILSFLFCLGLLAALPGCSLWHHKEQPKSSAHIYAGDAPTVHFSQTESAGGHLSTY